MSHGMTTDIYLYHVLHYNKLSFLPLLIGVKWKRSSVSSSALRESISHVRGCSAGMFVGTCAVKVLFKLVMLEK